MLTEAIGLVISPIYAPESALAIDGLTHAATLQRREGKEEVGQTALAIVRANHDCGFFIIVRVTAAYVEDQSDVIPSFVISISTAVTHPHVAPWAEIG